MSEPTPAGNDLGRKLRRARDRKDISLSAAAAVADISTAYLQKLEAGGVKQPSPNILHQLAQALDLDYAELMRLAGYIVPNRADDTGRRRNELTYALSSEELTEEEAEELAKYLDWYRTRNNS